VMKCRSFSYSLAVQSGSSVGLTIAIYYKCEMGYCGVRSRYQTGAWDEPCICSGKSDAPRQKFIEREWGGGGVEWSKL
jgi:hypothetical protein